MDLFTNSTIGGTGRDGRRHEVRIRRGFANQRHVVCDTCGFRQGANFLPRTKAEDHLATHGVTDTSRALNPVPIVISLVGLVIALLIWSGSGGA